MIRSTRGGLIVPRTTLKDFVCQAFSILELISPIIEQVTENNSVAAVSNTVLMKLEYGSVDFSCEQHLTDEGVREEQIRD